MISGPLRLGAVTLILAFVVLPLRAQEGAVAAPTHNANQSTSAAVNNGADAAAQRNDASGKPNGDNASSPDLPAGSNLVGEGDFNGPVSLDNAPAPKTRAIPAPPSWALWIPLLLIVLFQGIQIFQLGAMARAAGEAAKAAPAGAEMRARDRPAVQEAVIAALTPRFEDLGSKLEAIESRVKTLEERAHIGRRTENGDAGHRTKTRSGPATGSQPDPHKQGTATSGRISPEVSPIIARYNALMSYLDASGTERFMREYCFTWLTMRDDGIEFDAPAETGLMGFKDGGDVVIFPDFAIAREFSTRFCMSQNLDKPFRLLFDTNVDHSGRMQLLRAARVSRGPDNQLRVSKGEIQGFKE